MWISAEAAAAAEAGGVRPALLCRVAGDPIVRAWAGVGDFPVGIDAIETEAGALYRGAGLLNQWPPTEVLLGGEAGRFTVSFSGLDPVTQDLAEEEIAALEGAEANFGAVFLDARQQPIAAPLWFRNGEIEDVDIDAGPLDRKVLVTFGYGPLDRRRPILSHWSPQDQAARSAGDLFCDRTPLYHQGRMVTWPSW